MIIWSIFWFLEIVPLVIVIYFYIHTKFTTYLYFCKICYILFSRWTIHWTCTLWINADSFYDRLYTRITLFYCVQQLKWQGVIWRFFKNMYNKESILTEHCTLLVLISKCHHRKYFDHFYQLCNINSIGTHVPFYGVRFAKYHDTVLNGCQSAVCCIKSIFSTQCFDQSTHWDKYLWLLRQNARLNKRFAKIYSLQPMKFRL